MADYIIEFAQHSPNNWWTFSAPNSQFWVLLNGIIFVNFAVAYQLNSLYCSIVFIFTFCLPFYCPQLELFSNQKLNKTNTRAKHLSDCVSHKQTATAKATQMGMEMTTMQKLAASFSITKAMNECLHLWAKTCLSFLSFLSAFLQSQIPSPPAGLWTKQSVTVNHWGLVEAFSDVPMSHDLHIFWSLWFPKLFAFYF